MVLDVVGQIVGKLLKLDAGLGEPGLERLLAVPDVLVQGDLGGSVRRL